jgi:hypothetical protein
VLLLFCGDAHNSYKIYSVRQEDSTSYAPRSRSSSSGSGEELPSPQCELDHKRPLFATKSVVVLNKIEKRLLSCARRCRFNFPLGVVLPYGGRMDTSGSAADVAGIEAAISGARSGRGRRSQVYAWMLAHREELAALFRRQPPSWDGIARYLGERGLQSGRGLPPSGESCRHAWRTVLRNHAKAGQGDLLP